MGRRYYIEFTAVTPAKADSNIGDRDFKALGPLLLARLSFGKKTKFTENRPSRNNSLTALAPDVLENARLAMAALYALVSIAGGLAGGAAGAMLGGALWGLGGAVIGGNGLALLAGAVIACGDGHRRSVALDEHADELVRVLRESLPQQAPVYPSEPTQTLRSNQSRR
ncbi:hypothetical protein [Alsobacter sp. SYSU BS001988]